MKKFQSDRILFFICFAFVVIGGNSQNIYTIAGASGGFTVDGQPAINSALMGPYGVSVDAIGNVYIAEESFCKIRKINTSGILSTVLGLPYGGGYGGDGGPAISALIWGPRGVSVDASGNIYVADYYNERIRKVNPLGIVTTIAGTGTPGIAGNNGPANLAEISGPYGTYSDAMGNLYIAEINNNTIRKINTSGIISRVAGGTCINFGGDGGPALNACLYYPSDVTVDASGNIYIADYANHRIRKVNTLGIITTVAGNGVAGFSGDGGPAINAQLNFPRGVAVDAMGNIYIADRLNHRIRVVNSSGIISTLAGTGISGFSGDGGPSVNARINNPTKIALDVAGNVYFADYGNGKIRKICITNCFLSLEQISTEKATNTIIPNPNSGNFKIQNIKNDCEFVVSNLLGQIVYQKKLKEGENEITTDNLIKGLYYYSIIQNKIKTETGKIVIE